MSQKTSVLRARCSPTFKQDVEEFLRTHYPEEDEAWLVRNAVKEFMASKEKPPLFPPRPQSNSARVRLAGKKIVKIARRFASESANSPKP